MKANDYAYSAVCHGGTLQHVRNQLILTSHAWLAGQQNLKVKWEIRIK
jgi:hypothetical protein